MSEINKEKPVYLFVHGQKDLEQPAVKKLVQNGFSQEKIILAKSTEVGKVDDYMAMLWMPPNLDHIKIQKITKVDPVKPEGMLGLWEGVSKEDLFTIPLNE